MNSIALIWAQFGPYHFARVAALRSLSGAVAVHAIELSNQTNDYAWSRGQKDSHLHTLVNGQASEQLGFCKVFLRTRRKLAELKPDVCFLPSYWPQQSLAALLAARSLDVRTVMMNETHAGTARASGTVGRVKRQLLRLFDAGLVGGKPQKRYFESLGLSPQKIFTGYDAVDNDYFASRAEHSRKTARALREKYQLPDRYFLNLGRFIAKKNLETLVFAYSRYLLSTSGTVHLVLVGSGPEEMALRDLCHQLRLPIYEKAQLGRASAETPLRNKTSVRPGVHFYGFRQVDENPIFYGLAEAFVLPSKYEEWGLVVNEAMASGLPVVVSETAGCAEDLLEPAATACEGRDTTTEIAARQPEARCNGFVFEPDCSDQLARILVTLDQDEPMRVAMGRRSRQLIQQFSCEHFGHNAMAAARCALGTKPPPHVSGSSPAAVFKT